MLFEYISASYRNIILLIGAVVSVIFVYFLLSRAAKILPADRGRDYAVNSEKSKGKPTSTGLLFISLFCLLSLIFVPFCLEYTIYYILLLSAMVTGFLDDRAVTAWKEVKKGLLDLLISAGTACTFAFFQSTDIVLPILGKSFTISLPLFIILATILVWVSINVTNITDGVDGLSSSLVIISLLFIFLYTLLITKVESSWFYTFSLLIPILFIYLRFNASPSKLLMGDAGSRPLGVLLAISVLFSKNPFSYLLFCLVIIFDGGASLIKIPLKRYLHISVMKNIRTPLHDHARKNKLWSDPKVVTRFAIFHILICAAYLLLSFLFIR